MPLIQPPILFLLLSHSSRSNALHPFFLHSNDLVYSSRANGTIYRFNPIVDDNLQLHLDDTLHKFSTALFHAAVFESKKIVYIHINNLVLLSNRESKMHSLYVNLAKHSQPKPNQWISSILQSAPKFKTLPIIQTPLIMQSDQPAYIRTLFFFQIISSELTLHISMHTTSIRSGATINRENNQPTLTIKEDLEKPLTDLELSFLFADVYQLIALCNFLKIRYILKLNPDLIAEQNQLPKYYTDLFWSLMAHRTQGVS